MDIVSNDLQNMYLYPLRLVQLLVLTSVFVQRTTVSKDSQLLTVKRAGDCRQLSHQWDTYITASFQNSI